MKLKLRMADSDTHGWMFDSKWGDFFNAWSGTDVIVLAIYRMKNKINKLNGLQPNNP